RERCRVQADGGHDADPGEHGATGGRHGAPEGWPAASRAGPRTLTAEQFLDERPANPETGACPAGTAADSRRPARREAESSSVQLIANRGPGKMGPPARVFCWISRLHKYSLGMSPSPGGFA